MKRCLFLAVAGLLASGCSGEEAVAPKDGGADATDGGATTQMILHPNAPPLPGETTCVVIEETFDVGAVKHVPICQHVDYPMNPPAGGNHWPVWAQFGSFGAPVPREMYVHDLEHGAIVLSYRCNGPCPDVVAALNDVRTKQGDVFCDSQGAHARILVTPDPKLATPIAASAWGATYRATCIDEVSLRAFAQIRYGHGPEALCADGAAQSDFPVCP